MFTLLLVAVALLFISAAINVYRVVDQQGGGVIEGSVVLGASVAVAGLIIRTAIWFAEREG